jgi:hypothetical protein
MALAKEAGNETALSAWGNDMTSAPVRIAAAHPGAVAVVRRGLSKRLRGGLEANPRRVTHCRSSSLCSWG